MKPWVRHFKWEWPCLALEFASDEQWRAQDFISGVKFNYGQAPLGLYI